MHLYPESLNSNYSFHLSVVNENPLAGSMCVRGPTAGGNSCSLLRIVLVTVVKRVVHNDILHHRLATAFL